MGMTRDMAQRTSLARVDDLKRHGIVKAARRIIYEKNYMINTEAVEHLLQEDSLVPASVGCQFGYEIFVTPIVSECVLREVNATWLQNV